MSSKFDGVPYRQVVKAAGGATKLAEALGVSRALIYVWKRVPAEKVVEIEQITEIPREKLRPDLYRGFVRR